MYKCESNFRITTKISNNKKQATVPFSINRSSSLPKLKKPEAEQSPRNLSETNSDWPPRDKPASDAPIRPISHQRQPSLNPDGGRGQATRPLTNNIPKPRLLSIDKHNATTDLVSCSRITKNADNKVVCGEFQRGIWRGIWMTSWKGREVDP